VDHVVDTARQGIVEGEAMSVVCDFCGGALTPTLHRVQAALECLNCGREYYRYDGPPITVSGDAYSQWDTLARVRSLSEKQKYDWRQGVRLRRYGNG
jgi:transcription elongation factor Elf1